MLKIKQFVDKYKKAAALLLAGLFFFSFALCSMPVLAEETESDLTQYGMLPIYGNDIEDGEYSIDVKTNEEDFVIKSAKLTVADGKMQAELTLGNPEYSQFFLGDSEKILTPVRKDEGYPVYEFGVESLDRVVSCTVYDESNKEWGSAMILFEASSLPEKALRVELPDYDRIEDALEAYGETDEAEKTETLSPVSPVSVELKDGEYSVSVDMTGGSGKAFIQSPALLIVKDGKAYARVEWSSSNYDYMIVGTEKYLNLSEEDANSVFEIPIGSWNEEMPVIADTTAMGTPHEVSYTLTFYKSSIGSKGKVPQEAAKRVVIVAMIIIVGGGILNYIVKRRRIL